MRENLNDRKVSQKSRITEKSNDKKFDERRVYQKKVE